MRMDAAYPDVDVLVFELVGGLLTRVSAGR
jgi:hypothetical protein